MSRFAIPLLVCLASLAPAPVHAADPADVPGDWLAQVTQGIQASEYDVSPSSDGSGWTAPNRAQNLRARWHDGVIRLTPRTDGGAWSFTYEVVAFGRGGEAGSDVSAFGEDIGTARIEWLRSGGIREWYANDPRGIEQGFVLSDRPMGDPEQPIRLDALVSGLQAHPTDGCDAVIFRTPAGIDALVVRALVVTDGAGVVLPAWFEAGQDTVSVVIDDRDATYPLSVDPLMTSPAWMADGNDQDLAFFGTSVATAGDVDGDGYSDVIIGANNYDHPELSEGAAFVYRGSASGLLATPAATLDSNQSGAQFGASVSTAGDVNADGYSDVIVGAYYFDTGFLNAGRAFVYHGSASGLSTTPAWTASGTSAWAMFGLSVSTAGDVNNDGRSDVLVGCPSCDNPETDEGVVYVYHGGRKGLATAPATTLQMNQAGAGFGNVVAWAGDVNGDGFSDALVATDTWSNPESGEGAAFLFLGGSGGLATTPAWSVEGNADSAFLGAAAGTAGDVNGDGRADVLIGEIGWANPEVDEGRAMLFLGTSSGLAASPAWTAEGNIDDARMGWAVGTAGDVNGDGYADVLVGAPNLSDGQSQEGAAYAYLGGPAGLATTPFWSVEGNQATASYGGSVATAGDVNADGFSDVVIGAHHYSNPVSAEGAAFVYLGSAAGLSTTTGWSQEGNQFNGQFGHSVSSAGDVNADGYSDVIVGAWLFDNGELNEGRAFLYEGSATGLGTTPAWTGESNLANAFFGTSVSGAGDVNGDGRSDVIIGAENASNGEAFEGRAYVFHGSSTTGLSAAPAWITESNQASAFYGRSVSGAGDVNGDGFGDVIVGASEYDNGQSQEGRAYVYHGSATGLSTTPARTLEIDEAGALFGESVSSAGDMNGDGFGDVIVGARAHSGGEAGEGAAYAYLGSAAGIGATAFWQVESNQADANFGYVVANAGDVNGDGFSDVLVGANGWDSLSLPDVGAAFLYLGTGVGSPSTTPAWVAEGTQDSEELGAGLARAGDVNGDGYDDVIVGAPNFDSISGTNSGRAALYLGSASGVASSPAWTFEAAPGTKILGLDVGAAGDVNGDGFGDVIVGAPGSEDPDTAEGSALLFYGNEGDGLDRIPRHASTATVPLDLLGRTGTKSFVLKANGRSPWGRSRVRIEWEVKPRGVAFNGVGVLAGGYLDTGAPGASGSVVPLVATHSYGRRDPSGLYKWRLRLRSNGPLPWVSHWMSMPGNGMGECDLRKP